MGLSCIGSKGGSGPRLLFCNGSGATLQIVRPLLDVVAANFDLLAWDYRGLGRSLPLTGPYPMVDLAAGAVGLLETAGWDSASVGAKHQLDECVMRLRSAGIEIRTRHNDDRVAALETDLVHAQELSHRCNGWETRWFFRTMRDRDATKLSRAILQRAQKYEDLTLADHRADLKERARIRAVHAELAGHCDACITLAAPSGAPEGLASTGNPEFNVPASLLGVPALSLPLFAVGDMPLGLQLIGYHDRDADAFAVAGWLMASYS